MKEKVKNGRTKKQKSVFKKCIKNVINSMDLLFLLTLGDRVKMNVSNRVKLVRDFELLIDYEECNNYFNNFKLKVFEDNLFNQFVRMIERRANKCKNIKEKLNIENIETFLENWSEKNYYI